MNLLLVILDGWGCRDNPKGNAISLAKTPVWRRLLAQYPNTRLAASGEAVGLLPGIMGNSEVGHLTIGAGRIVDQDLVRIHKSIDDGSFYKNPILMKAVGLARETGKKVHLIGLLSDSGVHSHERHLFALLRLVKQWFADPSPTPRPRSGHPLPQVGEGKIVVHAFLDGRDTPPKSSQKYLAGLLGEMKMAGVGEIGTLVGRYYAMDRDKRWERVKIAYEALVEGKGDRPTDPISAIDQVYAEHVTDEFIKPVVFGSQTLIDDGDSVIFFNFRPDRARELTEALTSPSFNGFPRVKIPKLGMFVCFTEYDKTYDLPVAFPPAKPTRVLSEILSERGVAQFHTAETEKYAHVTYFLNGGIEKPFPLEERVLVPSPKEVPTYDKKPEMSALQVTEGAIKKIQEGMPVVVVNFANPDMVGHSGDLQATIRAVEVIDQCLGKLSQEVLARKGVMIITADHGNCEEMSYPDGSPHTAHTTNPVPFVLVGDAWRHVKLCSQCGLKDVAPTILNILGIPQPPEMTGESVIIES